VALELGSNEGIKEAVLRGLGLAILSTHVVQKQAEAGQLHILRVTGLALEREMFSSGTAAVSCPPPLSSFSTCSNPRRGPIPPHKSCL